MRSLVLAALLSALLLAGCGRSYTEARHAYDSGQGHQQDVRQALFTKAWGLNRALITESRKKWTKDAIIATLDAAQEGRITTAKSREIIDKLEEELGKDEVAASENFAYMAFLLTQGDVADAQMGNVDEFIESQRPLWMNLKNEKQTDFTAEQIAVMQAWEPLVKDLRSALPKRMIEQLKDPAAKPTSRPAK